MLEKQIVTYLVKKYRPLGIILHGSRAGNYATEHSDWDFFVICNEIIPTKRRHEQQNIGKQFLDIVIWQFPITDTDVKIYFAKYCGTSKLVYCTDSLVSKMFSEAKKLHRNGIHLTRKEIMLSKTNVKKSLERLHDWVLDDSGVFFLRSADLYQTLYNYWWNIKNNKYSVSTRQGLKVIKNKDKKFFDLLNIISSSTLNSKKYDALVKTYKEIFN